MDEEKSADDTNPIIGSNEHKIQLLKARKTELLLRKELAKTPDEIQHIEDLLKAVDETIKKNHVATTIRRRMRKSDEDAR
jgi:hypothetical protein